MQEREILSELQRLHREFVEHSGAAIDKSFEYGGWDATPASRELSELYQGRYIGFKDAAESILLLINAIKRA